MALWRTRPESVHKRFGIRSAQIPVMTNARSAKMFVSAKSSKNIEHEICRVLFDVNTCVDYRTLHAKVFRHAEFDFDTSEPPN